LSAWFNGCIVPNQCPILGSLNLAKKLGVNVGNGEEYDFLKTLSSERAQKTMEDPTNRRPISSSDR